MAEGKNALYKIKDIPPIALTDKAAARFVLGDNLLVNFIEQQPGAVFPIHSHDAEQILIILEGSQEQMIDGKEVHMEAGDVSVHPSGIPHGGYTKTGFKGIDIFTPPREDYVALVKKQQQEKK